MSQNPYDYSTRRGLRPVSWSEFHGICKGLTAAVAPFAPEIVLPIGRGGHYPGTLISQLLQAEIYPVRVSRRVNDVVKFDTPQWRMRPPELVQHHRVLIVDEICGSGETLKMVKAEVEKLGAAAVRTAVMYAHTWGTAIPDYIGLISDELLLNPWDREIFADGEFQFNPEYVTALREQGVEPHDDLLIDAPIIKAVKG
jgi:hypoxanthine phosphoribosyltransferase